MKRTPGFCVVDAKIKEQGRICIRPCSLIFA